MAMGLILVALGLTASEGVRRPAEAVVQVGTGMFLGDLGEITSTGGMLGARIGEQFAPGYALELAWDRLAAERNPALGPGHDVILHTLGAQVKVGVPIQRRLADVQPYALVGLGGAYVFYGNGPPFDDPDEYTLAVPVGAGVEVGFKGGFLLDGRVAWRLLAGERTAIAPSGNTWSATISLGAHFDAD